MFALTQAEVKKLSNSEIETFNSSNCLKVQTVARQKSQEIYKKLFCFDFKPLSAIQLIGGIGLPQILFSWQHLSPKHCSLRPRQK
jgi:hypothetical protein